MVSECKAYVSVFYQNVKEQASVYSSDKFLPRHMLHIEFSFIDEISILPPCPPIMFNVKPQCFLVCLR